MNTPVTFARYAKDLAGVRADIELLTAEVEAHRHVLVWLLKQAPEGSAIRFLRGLSNDFEESCLENAHHVVAELDTLRDFLSSSPAQGDDA